MPQDARIQEMLNILIEDPARKGTVTEWGERLGMSGRTLNRLLIADIGMSFSRWRRQLHLVYGLRRLIAGDRVQDIAHDFGYENASSFITMFRKTIGKSPGRFLTEDIRGTIE
jgi:AraC-like DNA-binding protein